MKPALLEVMRMNRICRMVLATCLGSFILVIFYFQSMLHPGRGRVSVVLLDIFFFLVLSLPRSPWLASDSSNLTSSLWATSGFLADRICPDPRVRLGRKDILLPLLPPNSRLEDGTRGAVDFFFFSLCLLSVCEVAEQGRGCGKLLGVEDQFEENETPSSLLPRSEVERGAGSQSPRSPESCLFLVGGRGRRVSAGRGCSSGRELGSLRVGSHVCGFRRRAEQVEGDIGGARHCPPTPAGVGSRPRLLAPGARLRIDLAASATGPAPSLTERLATLCWGVLRASVSRRFSLGGNFGRFWADRQLHPPPTRGF